MALFLLRQPQWPDPEVSVSTDGLAHAEWRFPPFPIRSAGNGILAMEFLPFGKIRFAAVSSPYRKGVERLSVHGTLAAEDALQAIRPFSCRLER